MREQKPFGKRQENKRLPSDKVLAETFGVTNKGCDSKQVVDFIRKTTGHKLELKE